MTFEDKAEIVITQLRADRDRLVKALNNIRAEIDLETRIQVKHYTNTDAVIDAVLDVIDEQAYTGGTL